MFILTGIGITIMKNQIRVYIYIYMTTIRKSSKLKGVSRVSK